VKECYGDNADISNNVYHNVTKDLGCY